MVWKANSKWVIQCEKGRKTIQGNGFRCCLQHLPWTFLLLISFAKISCVQAFYGSHVSQKYDKLQSNLKQFKERKPSQYNSSSAEMLFKWSGLLTITFGPSILMWMFGKKWPLYQKEMFFYASPNYIHSWLDPEDLMKIRLHTWNHTAEMSPLCLKYY